MSTDTAVGDAARPADDLDDGMELSCIEGGGVLERFETAFAEAAGAPFALALSSGTAALHTALLACDLGPGDEVIVSPYGWGQAVAAVLLVGAVPVFADIDPVTGNLEPAAVAAVVSSATAAVLVTHVFGAPADMRALRELCTRQGLWLLADAAQGLGARCGGRPVGALADISCYSLGLGKAVSVGEGGMAVTADVDLLERMLLVSQHPLRGLREIESPLLRASVSELSLSYRLSRPACELGLAALRRLDAKIAARRAVAERLRRRIATLEGLALTGECAGDRHAYHGLVLRAAAGPADTDQRSGAIAALAAQGIQAARGPVRRPIHLRPPFAEATGPRWMPRALLPHARHPSWRTGSCPAAERRCAAEELVVAGADL